MIGPTEKQEVFSIFFDPTNNAEVISKGDVRHKMLFSYVWPISPKTCFVEEKNWGDN